MGTAAQFNTGGLPPRVTHTGAQANAGTNGKNAQSAQPSAAPAPKPRKMWTASELLQTDFPAPVWIVPDLLPVGLGYLAGRPKQGKSRLALDLAVAVDTGGCFLGQQVDKGPVLYIALEDGPRRIKDRLEAMATLTTCGVSFYFEWPTISHNSQGLAELKAKITQMGARLVIIDTLTRAVGGHRMDWDNLAAVTGIMDDLQRMALDNDVCILLIDHHRKGNGQNADLIDDVMGSTAKTAAADTVWGLYRERGKQDATLKVTGRDIEEQELTIAFDALSCCWQVVNGTLGSIKPTVKPGTIQADIMDALENLGEATATELSVCLGKDKGNLYRELMELVNKGLIEKKNPTDRYSPYVIS